MCIRDRFVHSPDGGESWSHSIVISEDGSDNRNPAFGVTSKGTLLASFIKQVNYTDGVYLIGNKEDVPIKSTPLYLSRSEDHGKTWTTELAKVDGNDEFIVGSPFGKMLTLSDGRIMMHYYLHGVTAFITSDDDGHTLSLIHISEPTRPY